MERYDVTGMSCAACSARVEKAVGKVPGVTSCAVSLLTNSMNVEGSASSEAIIKAVEDAGYGAALKGASSRQAPGTPGRQSSGASGRLVQGSPAAQDDPLKDTETPRLKKRLIRSAAVLAVLMYFSMGHMMWGWPAPAAFDNHVFLGTFEMLLAIICLVINGKFFTSGFRSLLHGAPNMDTLVALGSAASFGYSLVELFAMILAQGNGDHETVMAYGMNLYFESAAMIPTLITVGKMLEAKSKGRTTDALRSLMKLAPKTALLVGEDGSETEVPIESVQTGDIFAVRPGDSVPVDGIVVEGSTAINESALTGESIPVDKEPGDVVSAATVNQAGYIRCRATRVGEDTTLAQIIRTVSDAAATKAPLARIADRVSGIFVPAVIGIAVLTLAGWLLAGKPFSFAIARAISVLVISCPCALGLATPVAIMVGSGMGAKNGILYKTAASLEAAGRASVVALDKTGTITEGRPVVTDVLPALGISRDELLAKAGSLESRSEHPLAKAVMEEAGGLTLSDVSDFKALPGNGLQAMLNGTLLQGGSLKFMGGCRGVDERVRRQAEALALQGKTPLLFAEDDALLGLIAVADTIKADSREAVKQLRDMGLDVVMLTGDNERTAKAIGEQAGVDRVIAGVLPSEKAKVIEDLKKSGKVIMVGDGINDAPALTTADTGLAIGAGADVAIDAADVVLMKNSLLDAAAAVRLSRRVIRNIHQNLFWAFFYNAICIPLAMGLYGIAMKPMYGAAAMSLSSFCVCMNALRLNLVDIHKPSEGGRRSRRGAEVPAGDKDIIAVQKTAEIADFTDHEAIEEERNMTKTLTVEGMMCMHCEARVKKALEAIDGVESAVASHEAGTAVVTLSKDVPDDVLKAAVEAQDYPVKGIA
ncbi:MAG: heavy metal translocating P-type ATPase [Clostridia bacterium]|nr:heavy metal translocating P-type ATPase [Clostridia bacterium]